MAHKKLKFGEVIVDSASELPPMASSLERMDMNKTSSWRSIRPVIDNKKCKLCMRCWKVCPEPSITPTEPPTINYEYCKGCGICIEECPFDAITSEKEGK